jgi:hypothetical protein
MGGQIPEVVEIARFVSRRVRKGNDFLRRDLVKRIHLDRLAFRQIRELLVRPQDRP